MHVAQQYARFWDNDMHQIKGLEARRLNPFQRDTL